jgi:LAO/AO transport system kinase
MEIADIFVVNKADRPGAADARRDLDGMLELSGRVSWRPPIVCTVATTGDGVDELFEAITRHRAHMESSGDAQRRRKQRLREELRGLVAARMHERAAEVCDGAAFDAQVEAVTARQRDPYAAADALLGG